MNIFLWIVGLILMGVATGFYIGFANSRMKAERYKIATAMIIAGAVLFILGNSFQILPTGYTGVRTTFG